MNVADKQSVDTGVAAVLAQFGQIDILVNNAGIMPASDIDALKTIPYELGLEHPASFNKLFKGKTNVSPMAFREKFN